MNWIKLTDINQLNQIRENSRETPIMIFKHSTSCSTSNMVKSRLERNWNQEEMKHVQPYYLDLLGYREISNIISRQYNIRHESPQVLIIRGGEAVYNLSHFEIDYASVQKAVGM